MSGPSSAFELSDVTWEDADDIIQAADFVVLPCGSIEQHSTHLPLGTDALRADSLARKLAETAPDHGLELALLPTLPYGYAEHHMNFPGTITLTPDTYVDAVVDVGRSVGRHGADRFVLLNFHGGNREPLKLAADRLQRDHDLPTYRFSWTDFEVERLRERFGDDWGHAGPYETSAMEVLFPDLVREERKEPPTRTPGSEVKQVAYLDEITEEGGLGDPTDSDPEFLGRLIDDATARILDALEAETGADG